MPLLFPDSFGLHDSVTGSMRFRAKDGKKQILCSIADAALHERFGARSGERADIYEAFHRNRRAIEQAAARKYERSGGASLEISLTIEDFC